MFIRSEYLFWYTCVMPEGVHAYIDRNMNCEDIAMQMLASGNLKFYLFYLFFYYCSIAQLFKKSTQYKVLKK